MARTGSVDPKRARKDRKTAHVPAGNANGGQFTGRSNPPSGSIKPKPAPKKRKRTSVSSEAIRQVAGGGRQTIYGPAGYSPTFDATSDKPAPPKAAPKPRAPRKARQPATPSSKLTAAEERLQRAEEKLSVKVARGGWRIGDSFVYDDPDAREVLLARKAVERAKNPKSAPKPRAPRKAADKAHEEAMAPFLPPKDEQFYPRSFDPAKLTYGADGELDAYGVARMYGKRNLRKYYKGITAATMREHARDVMARNPGTKPRSFTRKEDLIDYIVAHVPDSGDRPPKAAPSTKPLRRRKPPSSEQRAVNNLKRRAKRGNMSVDDELAQLEHLQELQRTGQLSKPERARKRKSSAPANMGPYGPVPTGGRFPSRETVKREGRKRQRHTGTTVPRQGRRTRRTREESAAVYGEARRGLRNRRARGA